MLEQFVERTTIEWKTGTHKIVDAIEKKVKKK